MASSVCDDVIVWEYEADMASIYLPYEEAVSNALEKNYQKNKSCRRCSLNSNALHGYSVDFSTMKQISPLGAFRKIRRQTYDSKYHITKGVIWMWLTDSGWLSYDVDSIQAIENGYVNGSNQVDLEKERVGIPNIVYISGSHQKNKYSGFVRPIKRVHVAYITTTGTINVTATGTTASTATTSTTTGKGRRRTDKSASSQPIINGVSSTAGITTAGKDDFYEKYKEFCKRSQAKHGEDEHEVCPICLCELDGSEEISALTKCHHEFHVNCLKEYMKHQSKENVLHYLQCPRCKKINGVRRGNQPPGTMDVKVYRDRSVGGYPGVGMIQITYSFPSGFQTADHPNPGRRYHTSTFPRTAYLPDNKEGKKVLKMLKIAFDRKLTFTVGRSVTTGQEDCVVWNEIHHKTSPNDSYSGHGFPDPNYLANVTEELKQQGVTEEDIR